MPASYTVSLRCFTEPFWQLGDILQSFFFLLYCQYKVHSFLLFNQTDTCGIFQPIFTDSRVTSHMAPSCKEKYSPFHSRLPFAHTDSCCGGPPMCLLLSMPPICWPADNTTCYLRDEKPGCTTQWHERRKSSIQLHPWIGLLFCCSVSLRSVSIAISSLTRGSGEPCNGEAKLPEAQSCSIFPVRRYCTGSSLPEAY